MNGYEKAASIGISGTAVEIVAMLRTLTAQSISLAYLMELLNFRGMLRKTDGQNGQERWIGTLPNLKAALIAMGQTASVAAYEMWFSHVTNPRQTSWDTSLPAYAASFAAMEAAFAGQENMPTQADFDAVVALGGGRPYADLTVELYSSQKEAAETAQAKVDLVTIVDELKTEFDAKLNQALYSISTGAVTTREQILSVLLLE